MPAGLAIQKTIEALGQSLDFVAPDDAMLGKMHGRCRGVVGL
jgi:hypothetical protein